jgi:hypothetical protein
MDISPNAEGAEQLFTGSFRRSSKHCLAGEEDVRIPLFGDA